MQPNGKATIAALIAEVETLRLENEKLRKSNTSCANTVRDLLGRVEHLQSEKRAASRKTEYRKRPPVLRGRTVQSNVGCGPLYITLNEDDRGRPFELFFKLGKSGSCQQSYLEALGVAMSVGLRYGADPQKFIEKFEGMRCPNPKMRDGQGPTTLSCADGISQGLAKALSLALPGTDPEARAESAVVTVAEPQFPRPSEELREDQANRRSLDLIGHTGLGSNGNGAGASKGGAMMDVKRAMQTGVGLCPKCSGPLVSQGGCIQCLQQCGYVGKCS